VAVAAKQQSIQKSLYLLLLVVDVISDIEVGIRNAGAQVNVGPLPSVRGDPNQLRQLFQNLIENAVKYRRPDVASMIRISGEENNGICRVFVEDNGIGFDEKYLQKIFQPFQRLHGRNEHPGLGIGLAVCRKIADRHRGTITAASTPGEGSTFIVTLPAERGEP
jgi:light-regulated signal transduction histidine kinase (bacteriophytochrome)